MTQADPRPASQPAQSTSAFTVRDATRGDAEACRAIYAPYVTDTAVTFETEVPDVEDMAARIAVADERHAWLVLEHDSGVKGYAYGGPFRSRAAYRWSAEVSVYLDRALQGRGAGRALYAELLPRLTARGLVTAVAGMTLPNDASAALHRSLGFTDVGVYRRIGYKLGAWHDVAWMQCDLTPAVARPVAPH